MELRRRPFVIVDEPLSKRFVQFGRVVKAHPGDFERGSPSLGEMGFDVPTLSIYLRGFGNDPAEGAAGRGGAASAAARRGRAVILLAG